MLHSTLLLLLVAPLCPAQPAVDLSGYQPESGVAIRQDGTRLRVSWPLAEGEHGVLHLQLKPEEPLIEELGIAGKADGPPVVLLRKTNPVYVLTVGSRDLKQGWDVFFDNPPRRMHERFLATLSRSKVRVQSQGRRSTVVVEGLSAGPFQGDFRLTVYPGCRLVHAEAVVRTDQDACAFLYDAGLTSAAPDWQTVAWLDTNDQLQRVKATATTEAAAVASRHRAIVAECRDGSVAVFPPPHQFLYPLDFAENFKFTWHGKGHQGKVADWGIGVRQPPDGDQRYVPWVNAPPGTQQRLGLFYLLSRGPATDALAEVRRFTHGDRFKKLDGFHTFSSHYHVEHTLELIREQKAQKTDGIPKGLETPPFVRAFKSHGIDIVHLAEFHVRHTPEMNEQRLPLLKTLHDECRRLSDERFLLVPGEEPNVHLGGHWISLFPRPVYWLLHPKPDAPFEQKVEGVGSVYAVKNPADVLRLFEKEQGLMWTAHPRIKSSYGFPDKYRETEFYRSDRFLGAAWKNMPADLSQPRLGRRVLDLFNDMANWEPRKYVLGEVDVFKVQPDYELYGHMNVNYVKLARLPRFEDGWQPLVDALRNGQFFVSTGEMLLPRFTVGGKESGQALRLPADGKVDVEAHIEWTFPPAFAEVILGDGKEVRRQRIDLSVEAAFSRKELKVPVELKGAKWVRFEVWDIAANGAFSQPVWVE